MARLDAKGRSKAALRHVRLHHWMMESVAWRSLPATATALYVEIAARYMGTNNGRIPYSVREAQQRFGISKATASRTFRVLIERGFLRIAKQGAFSLKQRHATEWRLTEYACDVTTTPATKDFMRWKPAENQNTGSVVKLTVPLVKPDGIPGETRVA